MNSANRLLRIVSALVLAVLIAVPVAPAGAADAVPLSFEGKFIQGGLVIGRAPDGSRITLDGKEIKQRADGRFLIGFGRDAKPEAVLQVRHGDALVTRSLAVKKRRYEIQRIDGLPPRMVTPPKEVLARIRADIQLIRGARLKDTDEPLFDTGFVWPVEGPISGVYGSQRVLNGKPRRPHFGIDIAVPEGTPVRAAAAGIVRVASPDMYYTGGTILIDHGFGLNTAYSHMARVDVKPGQRVAKGEMIGTVGSTGRSTGAHLDWRVNLFLTRLDPALLVPPMPSAPKEPR